MTIAQFVALLATMFATAVVPGPSDLLVVGRSIAAGFLTTVGDPKAILFYLSLLPAFVDMTAVTWRVALLVLVAATLTIASIKLGYALLSVRAKTYLESRNALVKTSAVSAAAAIVVGVYLLLPT
jgi:threonine/homoserine/homoserine lactone efflux protein